MVERCALSICLEIPVIVGKDPASMMEKDHITMTGVRRRPNSERKEDHSNIHELSLLLMDLLRQQAVVGKTINDPGLGPSIKSDLSIGPFRQKAERTGKVIEEGAEAEEHI